MILSKHQGPIYYDTTKVMRLMHLEERDTNMK